MQSGKGALAPFVENADQVDDRVGSGDALSDLALVGDVGGDGNDLSDVARCLQEGGSAWPAHGNDDPPAAGGQPADGIASDEAGTAEDNNRPNSHEDLQQHRLRMIEPRGLGVNCPQGCCHLTGFPCAH